jgi:hypothetical protein
MMAKLLSGAVAACLSMPALGAVPSSYPATYPVDEAYQLGRSLDAFDAQPATALPPRPWLLVERFRENNIVDAVAVGGSRRTALDRLVTMLSTNPVSETTRAGFSGYAAPADPDQLDEAQRDIERAAAAAFAFFITRDSRMLDDLEKRISVFAPVIAANCNREGLYHVRDYVWNFAVAYDFAVPQTTAQGRALHADRKAEIVDMISACMKRVDVQDLAAKVAGNNQHTIDFNALIKLIGANLLIRRDAAFAGKVEAGWLKPALQAYVPNLPNWGVAAPADGGYSNGSAYMFYDAAESALAWDAVERVLSFPLWKKPYLQKLPEFIAFTLPPQSPAGAFGDGAEVARTEERPRFGKAVTNRVQTPLAHWYSNALCQGLTSCDDPVRLHTLLSPSTATQPPAAAPAHLAAGFTSVGVAAFHSSWNNDRTSILFRGINRFGSLNHAHADLNSFTIYHRGKVLAMDSGHYDNTNTPHWYDWAKQTKAHNAITYAVTGADGQRVSGIGQSLGTAKIGIGIDTPERISVNPEVPRSEVSMTPSIPLTGTPYFYDKVVSDARAAYTSGPGITTKALRTLLYLRHPYNTVVVIDQLESDTARLWEYNLHTPVDLHSSTANGDMRFENGDANMCVRVKAFDPMTPVKSEGYTPVPNVKSPGPHYWRVFRSDKGTKSTSITFVSTYQIGCTTDGVAQTTFWSPSAASVSVGQFDIDISPTSITVR